MSELQQAQAVENDVQRRELAAAYQQWSNHLGALCGLAQTLQQKYPHDAETKLFVVDALRLSGEFAAALELYEELRPSASPNLLCRIQQGIDQCNSDQAYFPPDFEAQLNTGLFATGENAKIWRRYARSDVQRGRRLVRMLRQHTGFPGKRALDIGSGWGGLIIALAEEGADTAGIEYDPARVKICRDRLNEAHLDITVHEGDCCDPKIRERLGEFDIVTCQDVLEHVMDPETVIASMCAMVKPGGIIYMQVPNKWGLGQLVADHHFSLPGLTALAREQSREYWAKVIGRPAESYDVGFLKTARWYGAIFRRYGVQIQLLDTGSTFENVLAYKSEFDALCEKIKLPISSAIRPDLAQRVRNRMLNVAKLYANACNQIERLRVSSPELVPVACAAVTERLCLSLYRFIGQKTAK